MRPIDADALKPDMKTFLSAYSEELISSYSQKVIDNAPTLDVKTVRHGTWNPDVTGTPTKNWCCSECRGLVTVANFCNDCYYNYCPNCGAKMHKKDKET